MFRPEAMAEVSAEKGGIIHGPPRKGPFVVGRLAVLGGGESGEMTPEERHADALLSSFEEDVIKSPHLTILNVGDIMMALNRHSDGRNIADTRRVVANKIKEINPPRRVDCHTAGADLFFSRAGESMVGFLLDEKGNQQALKDREKLLEALDIEGTAPIPPHISAVRTKDLRYAKYVVRALNGTADPIRVRLSHVGPGAHVIENRHLRVV